MGNGTLPTSSLTAGAVDSSDPAWLASELDAPQARASNFQEIDLNGDAGLSQVGSVRPRLRVSHQRSA